MWSNAKNEKELLKQAIEFTGDHNKYGQAMREVIVKWEKTMLNSITNVNINRRAFLGHCAVSYKLSIPEYITRMAWKELTEEQRILADNEAQKCIDEYENKNRTVHKNLGKQMLLQWNP